MKNEIKKKLEDLKMFSNRKLTRYNDGSVELAENAVLDCVEDCIKQVKNKEKERLIWKIKMLKHQTMKETGSYKYDFVYDQIVELIEQL